MSARRASGGFRARTVSAAVAAAVLAFSATACAAHAPAAPTSAEVISSSHSPDFARHLPAIERWASTRNAHVALAVIDRETGMYVGLNDVDTIFTASVVKLFLAAELAHRDSVGERESSADDRDALAQMLSFSDDFAANSLWNEFDGAAAVASVADRYGLASTYGPADGMWWNTQTTVADLATFYAEFLEDFDDVGTRWTNRILDHLHNWSPTATDGYDQQFGLTAAIDSSELVAVKQGWMCCINAQWIHLSTGVVGPNNRYIVVVETSEDVQYPDGSVGLPDTSHTDATDDESAAHARETITGVVRALFSEVDTRGGR
ncbi:MAG: serine hydrolase [Rhodococcus sp.]|nr:serine hydrolase [Rhodococcus sp. (in: high G+C Gram-positive bacteria)]